MNCLVCKTNDMHEGTSTYFAQLPGCYIIIEHVPCWRCAQCGEVVYSASVMQRIDELIESVKAIATKVVITDYSRAA